VDHVAGDEHVLAGTTNQHRVMIDRVARRWNELHRFVKRKIGASANARVMFHRFKPYQAMSGVVRVVRQVCPHAACAEPS
jgi:hypothetical protein